MVMMEHNFGHDKGSLLHCLASMTKAAEKDLRYKNTESINVASRRHKVVPGGARTKHRRKTSTKDKGYDGGMEPIIIRPEDEWFIPLIGYYIFYLHYLHYSMDFHNIYELYTLFIAYLFKLDIILTSV